MIGIFSICVFSLKFTDTVLSYLQRILGTKIRNLKRKLKQSWRFDFAVQVRCHYFEIRISFPHHEKIDRSHLCCIFLTMNANAADKLLHVVSFKFKSAAAPEDIRKVEDAFRGLKEKIPQMVNLEWGTNVSNREPTTKGLRIVSS